MYLHLMMICPGDKLLVRLQPFTGLRDCRFYIAQACVHSLETQGVVEDDIFFWLRWDLVVVVVVMGMSISLQNLRGTGYDIVAKAMAASISHPAIIVSPMIVRSA